MASMTVRRVSGRKTRASRLCMPQPRAPQPLIGNGSGRGGTDGAIEELMEQPMLASVLDAGLAAFDLSCAGVGDVS